MPIKTGWRDAPLAFCNLPKAFKHNTICDINSIQTHNHLARKRTLNCFAKLAKWLTCVVSTYLYGIHLNFRYRACFEEGVSWHSGNYKVYIHSETCTWHDNNTGPLLSRGHQNSNKNDSLLLLFDSLWKVKANYMVWDNKHNILFFCVKMFKASGDSF